MPAVTDWRHGQIVRTVYYGGKILRIWPVSDDPRHGVASWAMEMWTSHIEMRFRGR